MVSYEQKGSRTETGATRSRSYRAFSRKVRLRGLDLLSTEVDIVALAL